ncbi:ATP-NAD kinase [Metschnikowia bicuspidata]|uniref:ATP-NAD kinase n=1 Tax=Metschnikowia bicuspidata TaxID=27322 RepID=A0A4P9ZBS6_9ASCO|nr:ATP-NAD kinase [Metschnikowia bicuspidata]
MSSNCLRRIESCVLLKGRTVPEYVGSPHLKLHNVIWSNAPQNIYVVKKPWNAKATHALLEIVKYIQSDFPGLNVVVAPQVADELRANRDVNEKFTVYTGTSSEIVAKTDMIVALGGDGTTLRAVSAFLNGSVPPVLSFAMGTLGFLLPFDFTKFKETIRCVIESRSKALHRKRLECHVVRKSEPNEALSAADGSQTAVADELNDELALQHRLAPYNQHHNSHMLFAMNDIYLHRGSQPNLVQLDIYIDNEFLTTTKADGVVFATPTGSTAYSLSSGGSIVHPLVPCILLTPVCPRSLSFRPLVLPATSHIMVKLSDRNRNQTIQMNIDGIPQLNLQQGDEIHVINEHGAIYTPDSHMKLSLEPRKGFDEHEPAMNYRPDSMAESPRGIFCIAKPKNYWTRGINELLGFNSSFGGSKAHP